MPFRFLPTLNRGNCDSKTGDSRMKNLMMSILLIFLAFFGNGQSKQQLIYLHTVSSEANKPIGQTTELLEAQEITDAIMEAIGLRANFEVKAARIPNAAAVMYRSKRYILYNPIFIEALIRRTGNEWAAVSVLAHEIGHHLSGHTLDTNGSTPPQELEADEFSGFVLKKMGASLEEAQLAMRVLAGRKETATHPAQTDRLIAIERGWISAEEDADNTGVAINRRFRAIPSPQILATEESVLAEQFIAANVHFNSDAAGKYYVTTKLNLVKVQNNQLLLIGKLSPLKSNKYPFLIHDEENHQLLIDASGSIVNSSGNKVGYLKSREKG